MPIHAILGATGGTGSAILRCLLSSQIPDLRINILVRSKSKLLQDFPQLELTSSATITIFEAPISNEDTLKACIKGASTIYVCVATNHASRKVDIALTAAARLVAALGQLRKDQGSEYKTPVVLFNRSLALNSDIQMPIQVLRRGSWSSQSGPSTRIFCMPVRCTLEPRRMDCSRASPRTHLD